MTTSVIPLASDMSNKAAFVNSLFAPEVRLPTSNHFLAHMQAGKLYYRYADAHSCGLILGAWLAAWQAATGGSYDAKALARCPSQDRGLIELLSSYVAQNQLALCRPQLSLDSLQPGTGLPIYRNAGYQRLAFVGSSGWNYGTFDRHGKVVGGGAATVAWLLHDLLFGAHVVCVSSSKDVSESVAPLKATLERALPTRVDVYNSHYSGVTGLLSGVYDDPTGAPTPSIADLDVETLATSDPPGNEPLAFALLAGVTALTHANDFMQLEGWPAQDALSPPGGARHNGDFETNTASFWNVSTFGACAFSEKRSTPQFLAPPSFDLTIQADTGMPHYWGANAGNVGASWMHADLIVT